MHIKQLESVFKLDSRKRYEYLIKKVADFQHVFLISDKAGNYVTIGNENEIVIPIWPELEYAQELLKKEWKNYNVKNIELSDFISWLDDLEKEQYLIGGFPNQNLNTVIVKPDEIKSHLIFECSKYE